MSDDAPNNGNLNNFIAATLETARDRMATKDDLARLEERLTTKLGAETVAARGDAGRIDLRLDSLERMLRVRLDQMDAGISRLRGVVYLLAKDGPEVLRLLGEHPKAGGETRP